MSTFKNTVSGQSQFRVEKDIKSRFDASADGIIDGVQFELLPEKEALGLLPERVITGDQAKFFPDLENGTGAAGIITGSIVRDTENGIVYIPIRFEDFQNNIIGPGSHISKSFGLNTKTVKSSSFVDVSSSFVNQFTGTSPDTIVQYMVEENYSVPPGTTQNIRGFIIDKTLANTVPFTGSVDLKTPDGFTSSFSGIHAPRPGFDQTPGLRGFEDGVELMVDLSDSVSPTHFSMRGTPVNDAFGAGSRDIFVTSLMTNGALNLTGSRLLFQNSSSNGPQVAGQRRHGTSSYATGPFMKNPATSFITGSNIFAAGAASSSMGGTINTSTNVITVNSASVFSAISSGSGDIPFTNGILKNINSSSAADGTYLLYVFKGRIAGEADSGSLYDFFDFGGGKNSVEVVIYPFDTIVASASFHFLSASQVDSGDNTNADVTGSQNIKTLFYVSGSSTPGFSGLFTSSLGPLRLGSILHADPLLKTPAEFGYYSISGSTADSASLGVRTHVFNVGTASIDNSGATFDSSINMKNPRIVRTFAL